MKIGKERSRKMALKVANRIAEIEQATLSGKDRAYLISQVSARVNKGDLTGALSVAYQCAKELFPNDGTFTLDTAAEEIVRKITQAYTRNPADKPEERGTFIEIRGVKTGKLYLILNASIGTMRELRMTAQRIADKYKEQVSVKRVTKVKKNPAGNRKPARVVRVKKNPSFINIEKSAFKRGEYIGYGGGKVWRIAHDGERYIARPQDGGAQREYAKTLTVMSAKLSEMDGLKKNPIEPAAEIADAKTLFESFTGHEANTARRVKTPAARVALAIGPLLGVAYETTRDGKREKYFHEFRSNARPLLAASSDGRSLFMLGGAYRFTDRGIVDSPKKRSR